MQSGNFEQIFDAQKLINDGIANPDTFVKQKIVDMFKKHADEFERIPQIKKFLLKYKVDDLKNIDVNSPIIKYFKAM